MKKLNNMREKIVLLENNLTMYKDALFSQRYIGGARFDTRNNDKVIKLIMQAQKNISRKKYKKALEKIDQALKMDEYLAQAHLLKGTAYFVLKKYRLARTSWERALEIDPYNNEVLKYLKRLYKKLGVPPQKAIDTAMELRKQTRLPASLK